MTETTKSWVDRTCSPIKRKARRATIAVGWAALVLLLVGWAVSMMVVAWQEPGLSAAIGGVVAAASFIQWLTLDDCEEQQ